jgi:hypothetical protein
MLPVFRYQQTGNKAEEKTAETVELLDFIAVQSDE